jgi:hypothetical protein
MLWICSEENVYAKCSSDCMMNKDECEKSIKSSDDFL